MSSTKPIAKKTKAKPAKRARGAKSLPPMSGRLVFRITLGVVTVLTFVACLLFDTQALFQLLWMGVQSGTTWLFAHRVTFAAAVMGVGLIVWGGWQVQIAPTAAQRTSGKAVKAKNGRDSRGSRPAQSRRASGQRRSTMSPRF